MIGTPLISKEASACRRIRSEKTTSFGRLLLFARHDRLYSVTAGVRDTNVVSRRDKREQTIELQSNISPWGVHTGGSFHVKRVKFKSFHRD